MRYMYLIFFSIFILLYSLCNYYIGTRFLKVVSNLIPHFNTKIYWTIFWLFAFSYLFERIFRNFIPYAISNIFTVVGAYWLGIVFYSVIVTFFFDVIIFLDKFLKFIPKSIKYNPNIVQYVGIPAIFIIISIIFYGAWNAQNTHIVHYDVNISKNAGNIHSLHIVALSDIHLGTIVDEKRIQKAANMINKLNPDLVLFVGDIVDEDINVFKEKDMVNIFGTIKSKYGKYAVLGNHEYISQHVDEAIEYIEKSGIKVLRDKYVQIDDSFYIVGRDDIHNHTANNKLAISIKDIIKDIDKSLPLILLDHQPSRIRESQQNGIDLQLSGHTHKGQLFPIRLITKIMFENDWGYLKYGNFNSIVSSGFGTWGPPIRIGTQSEILDIKVNFK